MEHKREIIRKIVRLLRQANERELIIALQFIRSLLDK